MLEENFDYNIEFRVPFLIAVALQAITVTVFLSYAFDLELRDVLIFHSRDTMQVMKTILIQQKYKDTLAMFIE